MLANDDDFQWEDNFESKVNAIRLLTLADVASGKKSKGKKASKKRRSMKRRRSKRK